MAYSVNVMMTCGRPIWCRLF